MRELALHILDITENSVSAQAKHVEISLDVDFERDRLVIAISDDGCGMDEEMVKKVCDPFTTTRKTRSVGMGLPLFKYSAESSGGSFSIRSEKGKGTRVQAEYRISHVDRMPLGDFGGVVLQLITMHPEVDFRFSVKNGERSGQLDTAELKEILGDTAALNEPAIRNFLREYIEENLVSLYGGGL